MIPFLTWWELLIVVLVWALIPAVLWLKRRTDREHADADRQLAVELQTILGSTQCGVCAAIFRPGQKGNHCSFCGREICMWCCDRIAGGVWVEGLKHGGTFICTNCTEGPSAA